jgi:cytochrome bd-type quinol oxidase subunit 2
LLLQRGCRRNGLWALLSLPLAIAVWWCSYLGGFGADAMGNVRELFTLAAIYVLATYIALLLHRRASRSTAVSLTFAVACLGAVLLLRLITPAIGE